MTMDPHFKQTLDQAAEIVTKWPTWKQNIIEFTAMATRPVPRPLIMEDSARTMGKNEGEKLR